MCAYLRNIGCKQSSHVNNGRFVIGTPRSDRERHQYSVVVGVVDRLGDGQLRIGNDTVVYQLEKDPVVLAQLPFDDPAAKGLASVSDSVGRPLYLGDQKKLLA